MRPETRYALSRGGYLAYQTLGEGPVDLVMVAELLSHCEHRWEEPALTRSVERLAEVARVVLFDKRGTGLSDPVPLDRLPTLEERADDLAAVLDAVGCRAVPCPDSPRVVWTPSLRGHSPGACVVAGAVRRVAVLLRRRLISRRLGPAAIRRPGRRGVEQLGARRAASADRTLVADDQRLLSWWAGYERLAASPVSPRRSYVSLSTSTCAPAVDDQCRHDGDPPRR